MMLKMNSYWYFLKTYCQVNKSVQQISRNSLILLLENMCIEKYKEE